MLLCTFQMSHIALQVFQYIVTVTDSTSIPWAVNFPKKIRPYWEPLGHSFGYVILLVSLFKTIESDDVIWSSRGEFHFNLSIKNLLSDCSFKFWHLINDKTSSKQLFELICSLFFFIFQTSIEELYENNLFLLNHSMDAFCFFVFVWLFDVHPIKLLFKV